MLVNEGIVFPPIIDIGFLAKRSRPQMPTYLLRQPADQSRIKYSRPKNITRTISCQRYEWSRQRRMREKNRWRRNESSAVCCCRRSVSSWTAASAKCSSTTCYSNSLRSIDYFHRNAIYHRLICTTWLPDSSCFLQNLREPEKHQHIYTSGRKKKGLNQYQSWVCRDADQWFILLPCHLGRLARLLFAINYKCPFFTLFPDLQIWAKFLQISQTLQYILSFSRFLKKINFHFCIDLCPRITDTCRISMCPLLNMRPTNHSKPLN